MNDGIKFTISADATAFAEALTAAGSKVEQLKSAAGDASASASASFGRMAGALAGVTAAAAAMGSAFRSAAALEQTQVAFRTLVGDVEAADAAISSIRALAASTPFEFPELAGAGRKLLAFGTAAGDVAETLRRIGDVAAGIQAPVAEIAELYGKAQVQGRLFGEDINQFQGRGIPIVQELARVLGVNQDRIRGLVEEGRIGFPELEKAFRGMTDEGGKFHGMMEAQSGTLAGKLSTLKDAWNEMATSLAVEFVPMAKNALDGLMPIVKAIGEAVSGIMKYYRFAAATAGGLAMGMGLQEAGMNAANSEGMWPSGEPAAPPRAAGGPAGRSPGGISGAAGLGVPAPPPPGPAPAAPPPPPGPGAAGHLRAPAGLAGLAVAGGLLPEGFGLGSPAARRARADAAAAASAASAAARADAAASAAARAPAATPWWQAPLEQWERPSEGRSRTYDAAESTRRQFERLPELTRAMMGGNPVEQLAAYLAEEAGPVQRGVLDDLFGNKTMTSVFDPSSLEALARQVLDHKGRYHLEADAQGPPGRRPRGVDSATWDKFRDELAARAKAAEQAGRDAAGSPLGDAGPRDPSALISRSNTLLDSIDQRLSNLEAA